MTFEAIGDWVLEVIQEIFDFLLWLPKQIFKELTEAVATLVESLPAPDFASLNPSDYIHDDVAWFLAMSDFDVALGIIGGAIAFRIIRRVVTLGIW